MSYSFKLYFNELDEDLQNEKIDEVITYDWKNGNIDKEKYKSLDEVLENESYRDQIRVYIEMHFPIYF